MQFRSFWISPRNNSSSSVTLPIKGTQQLKVTATWSDGTTADVTSQAFYTGNNSIATVSGGLVTGVAVGSTSIDVSYTDSAGNTVTATPVPVMVNNPVMSIAVMPTSVTLPIKGTQQLTVTATMIDKSTANVTSQAS
jgi:hypothetical protein